MNTKRWVGWCVAVLLAAGLMWTTGCSDDDDDSDDSPPVVTNQPPPVVTNAPAPQPLVAPQLVTPEDEMSYNSYGGQKVNVNFEWTAVPGAKSYILELNSVQNPVAGTTQTLALNAGVYQWRVWGKDKDGASGPPSAKFKVTIVAAVGPPAP